MTGADRCCPRRNRCCCPWHRAGRIPPAPRPRSVGCCELDLDGKVTFVNPAGVVGVAPRDLMGQPGALFGPSGLSGFRGRTGLPGGPREPARVTSPGRVVENAYTKPTTGASRPATAPPASGATTGIHA
ncbi:hypothetical protein GA0115260_107303 [Streptomyces sp. MnatMP-M27]|nr:hypothetical protein GA0115260_107303 [Streptomyces sp. MnatMP-M27]